MLYSTRQRLTTIAFSLAGVIAFLALGLPLPFLLGPMFLCLASAMAGAKLQSLGVVETVFRTILGVAAGASITPDIIIQIPSMAKSLAILPVFVATVAATSYPLMRRVFGFDRVTSYYSAMPGGLQDLMVFGEEAGANLRALALIHATRVLLIVSIMPLIMVAFWNVDLTQSPGAPTRETPPLQILLFVIAGLGGWQIAKRIRIFGASIIGPMVVSAVLSMSGIITQRPPAEMIWAAQFFIGTTVGAKYTGITIGEIRHVVFAGIANGILLGIVSSIFVMAIIAAGFGNSIDALLAYLPGGQGEMVVLALIAGADLTYVVLHHVLRIFLVVTCAPLIFKMFERDRK